MDWSYFVILAGMRTGSNLLEGNLNTYPGLTCHGELFNPTFMGIEGEETRFGLTLEDRDRDPMQLIAAMRRDTKGLAGFRLFHDHDRRVFDKVLADPKVAKIVLSRNPLQSYVSLKIAEATGQWKLGDLKTLTPGQMDFDRGEFLRHLDNSRKYQSRIIEALQKSGQTAYFLTYEDTQDSDITQGVVRYLGGGEVPDGTAPRLRKQNPEGLEAKVRNYDDMVAALNDIDHFDLARQPVFEPKRGPALGQCIAAPSSPVVYMRLRGGPRASIPRWLAALDGQPSDAVQTDFTQKTLRQWMRKAGRFRSFTVVRHPVLRLHETFCKHILIPGPDALMQLRKTIRERYKMPFPEEGPGPNWSAADHKAAFLAFIRFIAGNMGGQTWYRVDGSWASQHVLIQGVADFSMPEMILREDELPEGLNRLAADIGLPAPDYIPDVPIGPWPLGAIYDDQIEDEIRAIYQRDYLLLGYRRWQS